VSRLKDSSVCQANELLCGTSGLNALISGALLGTGFAFIYNQPPGFGGEYWWTTTPDSLPGVYISRELGIFNNQIRRNTRGETLGFSIRCVKD